ncbi:IS66 family insertion sequence element accessory protein TnpA, partial [Clostridium bornimense]
MYKKLSNDEWREYINRYYASDENLTVKDYCEENNINKSQFYYHKRKIEEKA